MNPFYVAPEEWVSPSLNRARLAGAGIPAGLQGKSGYALLAKEALERRIREAAPALGLAVDLPWGALLPGLEDAFTAADPAVRAAACDLGRSYGRGLGYLLLALKQAARLPGTEEAAAVRAAIRLDWQAQHWRFWAQIEDAVVGGGLAAGRLGTEMVEGAQAVLGRAGAPTLRLARGTRPDLLALLGAARYAPADCRAALAFDFGGTLVKRALVLYGRKELERAVCFETRASLCVEGGAPAIPPDGQLQQMAGIIADTWYEALAKGWQPEPVCCVALSTYLYRGQPYRQEANSCYGRLQGLGYLPTVLGEALAALLGRPVAVRLVHDGSAAAAVCAGATKRVVITLGTAIGHGFPPVGDGLWPLAREIEFVED